LSAIIFIYKSFKLSSTNLKTICASISIFFTLLWLSFTWKELKAETKAEPSANVVPSEPSANNVDVSYASEEMTNINPTLAKT
jgi:hypothetical protein